MLGDHELTAPDAHGRLGAAASSRSSAATRSRATFMRDIRTFTRRDGRLVRATRIARAMRVERRVVGPCPRCDGEIVERPKSYSCTSWKSKAEPGCGYTLWKQQGGRTITLEEARSTSRQGISADAQAPSASSSARARRRAAAARSSSARKSYGCTSWKCRTEPGCGYVIWKRSAAQQGRHGRGGAPRWCAAGETNAAPRSQRAARARARPRAAAAQIVENARSLRLHLAGRAGRSPAAGS